MLFGRVGGWLVASPFHDDKSADRPEWLVEFEVDAVVLD
jgi:hypothetical protein